MDLSDSQGNLLPQTATAPIAAATTGVAGRLLPDLRNPECAYQDQFLLGGPARISATAAPAVLPLFLGGHFLDSDLLSHNFTSCC